MWHNFAFLGQESIWAAEAAKCAEDQNQFWPYHDFLYVRQGAENSGRFSKPNLKQMAAQVGGIDQGRFGACLDSDQHLADVQAERQQGQQLGVRATPTLFVNGQKFEGAPTFDQMVQLVNRAATVPQPFASPAGR